jgi:hypothetical protein
VLEARARAANETRAGKTGGRRGTATSEHPDQQEALATIADALGAVLGADVRVRAERGGAYRAELRFETLEEALALAQRLRPRAVA